MKVLVTDSTENTGKKIFEVFLKLTRWMFPLKHLFGIKDTQEANNYEWKAVYCMYNAKGGHALILHTPHIKGSSSSYSYT